ncbi:MAG: S8 family serine peptidase [Anaerolineae bacterium]|nr:S8 family serine peptidase [Anaerolineae bacterium]
MKPRSRDHWRIWGRCWALLIVIVVLIGGGLFGKVWEAQAQGGRSKGRVIVQMVTPPLGSAKASDTALRAELDRIQKRVLDRVHEIVPSAQVEYSYKVTFNGVALRLSNTDDKVLEKIASLPEVKAVYKETAFVPTLFASLPLLHVEALWSQVGGESQAGAGVKIAILDSGIDITHPMLASAGFHYPPGYPKGDARYTTPKVVVARAYFRPEDPPPQEEASPLPGPQGSFHGTYLASVAAGARVLATWRGFTTEISGVAPRAWLMNYRIFYPNSQGEVFAYTAEILQAIEDAVADGAQVLCLGWSSLAACSPLSSPVAIALNTAMDSGCVVVAAAGNEGPGYGSASRIPGGIERVITVGSVSKDSVVGYDLVDVVSPEPVPENLRNQPFARALFGTEITSTLGPLPYVDVAQVDPSGSSLACQALPEGSLSAKAVLINRGECTFADKVYYAQQAGGEIALICNDSEDLFEMGCGGAHCAPGEINIPAVLVSHSFGERLRSWLTLHPTAELRLDPFRRALSTFGKVVSSFSGRGPAFARFLKPDVVAPGELVLSAGSNGGDAFVQTSGSSAACAHVAGAAALLLQLHPDWQHDQIKAALIGTANREVWQDEDATRPATSLECGAGLVDLSKASTPIAFVFPPSLALSTIFPGESREIALQLRAPRQQVSERKFQISSTLQGATLSFPSEVTLLPGEQVTVSLTVTVPADASPGDLTGTLWFSSGNDSLQVPLWIHIAPSLETAQVLLIDNDFSFFESYTDYAPYITKALDQLGVSYQVWNADEHFGGRQTIPSLGELQKFPVIIWLTGDNVHPDGYYALSTPLTKEDMQILASYLDAGGRILAVGQNLAMASDVNPDTDPMWERSFFYHAYLGAHWLQDSLFDPIGGGNLPPQGEPAVVGLPGTFLSGVRLHLGPVGDGAGNQRSIDEIAPGGLRDGSDRGDVFPILMATGGYPEEEGYVALAKSAEPTIDDPVGDFPYRALYLAFGFEGINDFPDMTSRKELLRRLLTWLQDEVTVQLPTELICSPNVLYPIACTAESSEGEIASFRWRLGEEKARVITSTSSEIICTFPSRGEYPILVEVTDSLGHSAVTESTVHVVRGGSSSFEVSAPTIELGGTLTYRVVARNSEATPLFLHFSLPLPPGTEYLDHVGGSFKDQELSWSWTLPGDSSYEARLRVRVNEVLPGQDIVATTRFEAGGDSFQRTCRTRVLAAVYLPLLLRP